MRRSLFVSVLVLALPLLVLSPCRGADDPLGASEDLSAVAVPMSSSENLIPGDGLPLLKIRGVGKLFSDGAELILVHHNETKTLGWLNRSALRKTYVFSKEKPGKGARTLASLAPTLSARRYQLFAGDRDVEVGTVQQRFFSWGTGLDVFVPGKTRVGYVDEKAAGTFRSMGAKRPFAFQRVDREMVTSRTMFGREKQKMEEVQKDCFWFIDRDFDHIGPGGLFMDLNQRPFLAVDGSWWMSEHIFDLFTTRREAEGATGTILRGLGNLLAENEEQRRAVNEGADDLVLNPTGYLGVFLAGIVYLPDFRSAVGFDVPIPAVK